MIDTVNYLLKFGIALIGKQQKQALHTHRIQALEPGRRIRLADFLRPTETHLFAYIS